MGVIEEEFNRSRNQASLLTPRGGAGLTPPPAAAATPAPQRAALLSTPSPGQQLRSAIAQQPASNLAETIAARNPAAVPAPDLRAQLSRPPQGPSLKETMASRAPVGPEPDLRTQLTRPQQGQTLGEAMASRAPVGPQPDLRTQLTRPQQAPSLGETIASRTPVGPPPPDLRAQLGRPQQGPTLGETVASRAPVGPPAPDLRAQLSRPQQGPTLAETVAARAPAGGGVRAAAMAATGNPTMPERMAAARAGFPPPPAAPAPTPAPAPAAGAAPGSPSVRTGLLGGAGAPTGAGGEGWYARATNAASTAAKPMMPAGSGMVGKAAGAASAGMLGVARKAVPYIEPLVEAARVGRVAMDPKSDGYDVATQVAEGVGRTASTIAGAGLLGAAGAAIGGPFAPVTGAIGGILGGIAGYAGGDHAIRELRARSDQLRSFVGLGGSTEVSSPVQRTDERYDIAKAARAATAAPKAGTPAAAATAPKAVKPAAATAAEPQAQPQAPAAGAAPATARPAVGGAAPVNPALAQQIEALQAQQDASPIARTVIGGGGSQVFYKDGSMSPLQPGQPVPEDVAQFDALHSQIRALRSGRPLPEAAPQAPAAPAAAQAPAGVQAGAPAPTGKQGKVAAFADKYGAAAARAAESLGVEPNVVLANWGHETGWGKSIIPGTNNLGNIKAVRGQGGVAATDNMTGSRDNYMNFESPDAFADHYVSLINKRYKDAMGAGGDMAKFAGALKAGGYAEDPKYASRLGAAYQTLLKAQGGAPGASVAAAAEGALVPQVASGINTPVHIIKGIEQSMAIPNGEGYDNVPLTVYDAARRSSNGFDANGPVAQYLDNVNQGIGYRANPASARLDEQSLQNAGTLNVANTTGGYHLAGQQLAAEAQKSVAGTQAQAGNRRYIEMKGGLDPTTMAPQPDRLYDTQTQSYVDAPAAATPLPQGLTSAQMRSNAINKAKASPEALDEINMTLKKYGQAPLASADLSN